MSQIYTPTPLMSSDPRHVSPHVPDTNAVPELDKPHRESFKKMADWTKAHLENSFANREHLERLWIRVISYMDGFHFFKIDSTGRWTYDTPEDGEIRSTVPLMRSIQRRELGRLTENVLTVKGVPTTTQSKGAAYMARRAELMVNAWQEETDFADTYEEWCNQAIHFGLSALHRYIDPIKQQVFCEAWSALELHPIPWSATKDSHLYGLSRVRRMPKSWIERNFGPEAASKAGRDPTGLRIGSLPSGNTMGRAVNDANEVEATVTWTWLLPTPEVPTGQYYAMVEDEIFAYQRQDSRTGEPILRNGKLPVELLRYATQQGNWYGMGLLPTVLGSQAEADRAMSKHVQSTVLNNGILFIDDEVVDMQQITGDHNGIVAYDRNAYDPTGKFFDLVPPTPQNRDVGGTIQLAIEQGRMAAGHDSDIIFGKAEGRVESGPASRILNVNAQAPVAPTLRRIERALFNTYNDVLDMIGVAWPDDKRVRVIGEYDLVNEQVIRKQDRPSSDNVLLRPHPLLPAGRLETYNQLLQLRQMAGDDQRPLISDEEFRRGVMAIGMGPPGLQIEDMVDDRIRQRVARLYNDGQTPGPFVATELEAKLLRNENIDKLRDALVEKILDPGFLDVASPKVMAAFNTALDIVTEIKNGDPMANSGYDVNTDAEDYDALKQEEFFDASEQRSDNFDGQFIGADQLPIGV